MTHATRNIRVRRNLFQLAVFHPIKDCLWNLGGVVTRKGWESCVRAWSLKKWLCRSVEMGKPIRAQNQQKY